MTANEPLANRMRPNTLNEIIGQEVALQPGSPLHNIVQGSGRQSILLYAPAGVGKTTVAKVIAQSTQSEFVELSAISATVKDVRDAISNAKKRLEQEDKLTILFIDEIHRFTKAQQDVLLSAVETGVITLIGATTENPSFSVNKALQSRCHLITLKPLDVDDLMIILDRALHSPKGLDDCVEIEDNALLSIATNSSGDARQALTLLETVANSAVAQNITIVDAEFVKSIAPNAILHYDRDGDMHYDIISAFIKSMRGSDPDAAVYWMARMLSAGEDPRYVARRMVIHASEDVGMADPNAMLIAAAAMDAAKEIGMPECQIPMAQAAIYIATAPKSPEVHDAIHKAMQAVKLTGDLDVPNHLKDNAYKGAKALGHGEGYKYPHSYTHGVVAQQYLPDKLLGAKFYHPRPQGNEKIIAQRLEAIQSVSQANAQGDPTGPPNTWQPPG